MICPNCRLYISDPSTEICPRCGQPQVDTSAGAQGYGQNYPRSGSSPAQYGDQSYNDQRYGNSSYGSQRYNNQPYGGSPYQPDYNNQGYGSQPYQPGYNTPPTFSQAAPPTWAPPTAPGQMPPARKTSVARRVFLYGGMSVGLIVVLLVLCIGGLAFIGSRASHNTGSATVTPFPGTSPGATILFQDALTSDTGSGWANDSDCFFQNASYHVKGGYFCPAPAGNIGDANITVQAKQLVGPLDIGYGIGFRRSSTNSYYEFEIASNSRWQFAKFVNGTFSTIVQPTLNAAIKGGLNTVNTLSVHAQGSHFEFYVNGTKLGEATDSTFSTGLAGLRAGNAGIEVAYNNYQITAAS
jgi:hypothetical protein